MGLDITAYRQVKKVGTAVDGDDHESRFDWETTDFVYPNQDYPERLPPIEPGAVYEYAPGNKFQFRAGSYSGYNRWREQLSVFSNSVMPEVIWKTPSQFDGKPFVELINFSDCEGVIGTEVSKKLAKDFRDMSPQMMRHPDEWFREKYQEWLKAFEMAADGGYVDFH